MPFPVPPPSPNRLATCATCRWWDETYGMCRRNPPAPHDYKAIWPETQPTDWCGQHQQR